MLISKKKENEIAPIVEEARTDDRLATSTPGRVEVNRCSAAVHSRAPELCLQRSLCFCSSSAGLTALPLSIVEKVP